jgi:hypothetical protein
VLLNFKWFVILLALTTGATMNATSRATLASGETKYTGGKTKSDVERTGFNVDDLPFATQIPDEYWNIAILLSHNL